MDSKKIKLDVFFTEKVKNEILLQRWPHKEVGSAWADAICQGCQMERISYAKHSPKEKCSIWHAILLLFAMNLKAFGECATFS